MDALGNRRLDRGLDARAACCKGYGFRGGRYREKTSDCGVGSVSLSAKVAQLRFLKPHRTENEIVQRSHRYEPRVLQFLQFRL